MTMNILTFTSLWPNVEQPNFGVFVKHRVAAMARLDGVNVRVVAPVPYFPKSFTHSLPLTGLNRLPQHWLRLARVPEVEEVGGLPTFYPRYLVTPKVGMRFYGSWMAKGAWQTVRRLHTEKPFDLIDAHYVYPDGFAAVELGRRLNIPVVISARGTDINHFSHLPYIRPKIINALNRAAGIITVSGALKQQMVALGIVGQKIAVIPNGIDRETFHLGDREAARRKLGLNAEDQIILTVSALIPRKGIDRLIGAMALLAVEAREKKLNPPKPLKLIVIGEGNERRVLESQIFNLALQDNVFLPGAKPQAALADWYAAADLFCLASYREGCPNVVVEAMACGLPVVVAEIDGIREFVDSTNGRVVASPSAENFAAQIKAALIAAWDRQKIAGVTRARSWDDVAAEVVKFYEQRGINL
ncbi:MAG: glycosyltransferase family 4 protein [Blastocatellia bacterium]